MPLPTHLLKLIGQAILANVNDSATGEVVVEVDLDLAEAVWQEWGRQSAEERLDEITALACADKAEIEQTASSVAAEVASAKPPQITEAVANYLTDVPAAIRRCLRLPADLSETTAILSKLQLGNEPRSPLELLAVLPRQLSWSLPEERAATPRARSRRSDVWELFDSLEQKAPELLKLLTNSIDMKLVLIPAGTFQMGTLATEEGSRENEQPCHEIMLTKPFYMAVMPVTQQQYLTVMGHNPARFHKDNGGGPEHPVENVTWEQTVEFCRRLSELPAEKEARRVYRLPTEAEWEYACRAGTTTPFCYGAALSSSQANFDGNFPYGNADKGRFVQKTTRVGLYPANNFGLHDMHGNVWEWCADWLDAMYYNESPRRDPQGPDKGRYRVLRGGCWRNHAVTCRTGYRNGLSPRIKDSATGFRVVLEV